MASSVWGLPHPPCLERHPKEQAQMARPHLFPVGRVPAPCVEVRLVPILVNRGKNRKNALF